MPACKDPEKEKERRRKLSEGRTGEKNWTFGKPFDQAHKDNISKALKGRVITPEWREKLRAARLGKKASDTTKQKMSETRTGNLNAFYGKKHDDETREHLSSDRIARKLSAGSNNPMYRDGSSFFPYCEKFNPSLRRRVRAFFNNTCQLCGHVHESGEVHMTVHHVNRKKDACCNKASEPLFVTLCTGEKGKHSCHTFVTHRHAYFETCFTQLIKTKYNGKCYFEKGEIVEDVALWGH